MSQWSESIHEGPPTIWLSCTPYAVLISRRSVMFWPMYRPPGWTMLKEKTLVSALDLMAATSNASSFGVCATSAATHVIATMGRIRRVFIPRATVAPCAILRGMKLSCLATALLRGLSSPGSAADDEADQCYPAAGPGDTTLAVQ